ncbi:ABC transporter permease [Plantactinospora endophytica]|uniref:Transport permease protein n=1 Tax=Plantactinospora endophytica TaxID=673535 RepID=A0ABQ4EC30_9ACTN|nr:ABC transporter permease [Plantactinospora endophytica]GIG92295.1 transport permease protein [Plantactinospora endophytica]
MTATVNSPAVLASRPPVVVPASAPPLGLGTAVRHALVMASRNLRKLRGDPGQLLDATVMPIVFTLAFVYVFGGAIAGDTGSYIEYFMPGIMALTVTIVSRTTGVGLAVDFGTGIVDRFRSLPVARSAVLAGRIISDAVRMTIAQFVILAFAVLIGFRVHTGPLELLAAIGLLVGFGVALSCVSAVIGLTARSLPTVDTIATLWMVPLQFGSSMFVPVETMPGWLQAFVKVNPMTLVVDACRGLLSGGEVAGPALGASIWIVGAVAVFGPIAVLRYRVKR